MKKTFLTLNYTTLHYIVAKNELQSYNYCTIIGFDWRREGGVGRGVLWTPEHQNILGLKS